MGNLGVTPILGNPQTMPKSKKYGHIRMIPNKNPTTLPINPCFQNVGIVKKEKTKIDQILRMSEVKSNSGNCFFFPLFLLDLL